MKKQIVWIALVLMLLVAGCQSGTEEEPTVNIPEQEDIVREKTEDFLGASDNAMVENKGEGQAVTHTKEGKQVISQRKYQEKLFNLEADVEYFYGDDGLVSEIVAVFQEDSRETIVSEMTKELGEPKEKQEETEETQFRYFWEKDGDTYTLLDPQNAAPAVIIQKAQQ